MAVLNAEAVLLQQYQAGPPLWQTPRHATPKASAAIKERRRRPQRKSALMARLGAWPHCSIPAAPSVPAAFGALAV